jgi:hypothetical protein
VRKGYQNLITNLRLLTEPKLADGVAWVSLGLDNGVTWQCDEIKFEGSGFQADIFGRLETHHEGSWVQISSDELVAITVGFKDADIKTAITLPALLDELREKATKKPKT